MTGNELFEQAQRLFVEGKHGESIEKFTEALKAGFEPGMTYLSRGAAYLKMNGADKAIEDFTRGITLGIVIIHRRAAEGAESVNSIFLLRGQKCRKFHGERFFVFRSLTGKQNSLNPPTADKSLRTLRLCGEMRFGPGSAGLR
jgi:tetratricopeptide (TPR) repeat protein